MPNSGSPSCAHTPWISLMPGHTPPESCQPPPEPAQPFAQDGARRHQPPVVLFQAAGERVDLAGGAHADGDQAGQQTGGDRQPRPLGDVVHLADDFDAVARLAGEPRQHIGQRLGGAFHARRHDAGGDHRGFQQPQIIAREIEDLGDATDVRRWLADPRWPGAAPADRSRGNRLPPAAWRGVAWPAAPRTPGRSKC